MFRGYMFRDKKSMLFIAFLVAISGFGDQQARLQITHSPRTMFGNQRLNTF